MLNERNIPTPENVFSTITSVVYYVNVKKQNKIFGQRETSPILSQCLFVIVSM